MVARGRWTGKSMVAPAGGGENRCASSPLSRLIARRFGRITLSTPSVSIRAGSESVIVHAGRTRIPCTGRKRFAVQRGTRESAVAPQETWSVAAIAAAKRNNPGVPQAVVDRLTTLLESELSAGPLSKVDSAKVARELIDGMQKDAQP